MTCRLLLLYLPILTLASPTAPAFAMQAAPSLAADSCVTFREDGSNSYRLVNRCAYTIEIAFCTQPKTDPGQCRGPLGWSREKLAAGADGQVRLQPEQALDLFACRQPGAVEILASGMARCTSASTVPEFPLLLSASLKNPGSIITDNDYPSRDHDKEGTTRFELLVGPNGNPISCTTTVSSGHDVLDKTACNAFLRRARFTPAKDASGNPTTGRYKGSVTWKAP